MRIGCLQFDPQVGEVEDNLNKADAILDNASFGKLDLLVLPELAFSGYNFQSQDHIAPFLEEQKGGVSSLWARSTALKHDCTVIVGYPEKAAPEPDGPAAAPIYNSAIIYDGDGDAIGNYRKTHLYYTDETWALEGHGFFKGYLAGQGMTTLGICMDINPYKFEAPWDKFEFARHAVAAGARLVILSMAWLTNNDPRAFNATPQKPDSETLLYWVARLQPIIDMDWDEEVIIIFANRCGAEDEATYAGTSAVIGIQSGQVHIYGILGRGSPELLVVDTDAAPLVRLSPRPVRIDASTANDKADENVHDAVKPQKGTDLASTKEEIPSPPAVTSQPPERTNISKRGVLRSGSDVFDARPPVSDDQYMLQRYLESEPPFSTGEFANVSLENSLRHLEVTNKVETPSYSQRVLSATGESRRAPRAFVVQDDASRPSLLSLAPEESDRVSVRSDVSVWNNQQGRVPNIISPISAMPDVQHQAVKQGTW